MKKIFILIGFIGFCQLSNAQLTIYSALNQQGTSGVCEERTIYKGVNIPNGLDDQIKSITLRKGFMATLAANIDGRGESFCYVASQSDINVNLANVMRDKVSFIRVLPITNIKKKGACEQNNNNIALMNVSWFYDWGIQDASLPSREFVPMAWGRNMAAPASVDAVIAKTGLTTFLGFNEPDNVGQANININDAAILYRELLRSGYRMGSPACTESQYRVWLSDFTTLANQDSSRIDFVCVHWYDWGNWLSTLNANPNATDVFNRFKSYINNVYNLYQKPIWITEFNANVNRPPAVHEAFMRLALPWLDSDPRIERYSYFFGNDVPVTSSGILTSAGRVYADHVSLDAYPQNIVDKRAGAGSVSVTDLNDAAFSVYPTTVLQGKIEVKFKEATDTGLIKIFNLNGQLVSSHKLQIGATSQTIDIAHFTEGGYVLTLYDKGSVLSRKFFKQ
ncbi:MAG: T9SS type A sorting domain-containing protein [Saprospiraceae bacterium]|nr:T9SS type A sorting domain-containing protein [Saprospiraceae bacterium]